MKVDKVRGILLFSMTLAVATFVIGIASYL